MDTKIELNPDAPAPRVCAIADALDIVGDRWSLVVLRELAFGITKFNDIQVNTGAPRETLSARLRKLEERGVLTKHRYSQRPPRDEYLLTAAGQELAPVMNELRKWGERNAR